MSKTTAELVSWIKSQDAIRTILVEVHDVTGSGSSVIRLSNKPYTTGQGETPASTSYLPLLVGSLSYNETLSLDGSASIGYGDIQITNTDGARDTWLTWTWVNKRITIDIGDPRWARDDFYRIFDGLVGDISAPSRNTLSITLLNKIERLNTAISEKTLAKLYPTVANGGIAGNENKPVGAVQNRDSILPLCFGECFNVTPLKISSALGTGTTNEEIYMVHDGAIQGIIEVRDNGVPLVEGTGYTANLTNGTITLLRPPAGTVTCSVQGSTLGGTYSNKIVDIIKYIVKTYGKQPLVDSDLSLSNLNDFNTLHPQPVGMYVTDRENVLDVCQRVANSVVASVHSSYAGELYLVKLDLPGVDVSAIGFSTTITESSLMYEGISISERPLVRGSIKLGYCRNWTPQDTLAGAVPSASTDNYKKEWFFEVKKDSSVLTTYKITEQPDEYEESLLLVQADAITEANRRLTLWKTQRSVYTCNCFSEFLPITIGMKVSIENYRYGLTPAKDGVVVSTQKDWITGNVTLGVLV